ncbi:hypothetical protein [Paraburkholderia lycopersici]|uniref:Uncharacterized protein n=1 Tax=Paraburkholderia lycopersici TaxID=416944 RepID=A0A1G6Z233_9BURK|nr:hypothetical protein [Paraburkholderia lycopersici]SDD96709.1 hypothetical protein SAMN05421548_12955 [Paraburkholderia lycopersici]
MNRADVGQDDDGPDDYPKDEEQGENYPKVGGQGDDDPKDKGQSDGLDPLGRVFDVALVELLGAIDVLAAERGWRTKRRKLRAPVLRVQRARSHESGESLECNPVQASEFSQLARQALELARRSEWNAAEWAVSRAVRAVRSMPFFSSGSSIVSTLCIDWAACGDRTTVITGTVEGGINSGLPGEPGQASAKMPAPPRQEDD